MTPPKPEPVETAEEFATRFVVAVLDGVRDDWTPTRQYGMATARVEARDAALVADAEARGARRVLEEMATLVSHSKWLNAETGSKEAGWGRAYQRAMRELRNKYTKGGADGG